MGKQNDLNRRVAELERWRDRVEDRLGKGAKTMAVLAEKLENLQLSDLKQVIKDLDTKLDDLCLKFAVMSGSGQGKNALGEGIVKYGGWILCVVSFLYAIYRTGGIQ